MKKRIFLLLAAACLIFAPMASADIVYTTGTYGSTGILGTVAPNASGEFAVSGPYLDIIDYNNTLCAFKDGDNPRLSLAENPSYMGEDAIRIFDSSNIGAGKSLYNGNITGVETIRNIVTKNSYAYVASYNNGKVVKANMASNYATAASYELSGANCECVALCGDYIYAVFTRSYGAESNILVKINPSDMQAVASKDLGTYNANGMSGYTPLKVSDGALYVVSYGEYDYETSSYNTAHTAIQKVNPDTLAITWEKIGAVALGITGYSAAEQEFVGSDVYTLASNGGYPNTTVKIFKNTIADFAATGNIGTEFQSFSGAGNCWNIEYDDKTSTLWVGTGSSLYALAADGTVKASFDATGLNGDAYMFAVIPQATPTPTPSGGSGGGCSAGFAGLALLAFAPLALRSRKKK